MGGKKGELRSKYMGKVERKDGLKSSVVAKQRSSPEHVNCNLKIPHEEVGGQVMRSCYEQPRNVDFCLWLHK